MKLIYLIVALCIMVVGASFAALNATPVMLNYYIGQLDMPLSLLLVLTLGMGGLMGMAVCMSIMMRVQYENRCLKKQIKLGEKEIANLRTLPLQDGHKSLG